MELKNWTKSLVTSIDVERLHEVVVNGLTRGARYAVRVIAEEVTLTLVWLNDEFSATIATEPLLAAGLSGEDVIRVQRPDDQVSSGPLGAAGHTAEILPLVLEATHANRVQVLSAIARWDRNGSGRMLTRGQEQGPVQERVSVKDVHRIMADTARNTSRAMLGERGQYERADVIAAIVILHFDVVRIDFVSRQTVEYRVIRSSREEPNLLLGLLLVIA